MLYSIGRVARGTRGAHTLRIPADLDKAWGVPQMRRTVRMIVIGLLAGVVLFGTSAVAHAALSDTPDPLATSESNPNTQHPDQLTPDTWWRITGAMPFGWGRSVTPDFALTPPTVISP